MRNENPDNQRLSMLRTAAFVLALAVGGLAWMLAGIAGLGYIGLYALLLVPGLPIGFALFGKRHAAGWIAGALIGYGLSALVLWLPAELHLASRAWLPAMWGALSTASFSVIHTTQALVHLPTWQRSDSLGLLCAMLVVPVLLAGPFPRIGELDEEGNRRYRAYFTADFLWHVALTAELTKVDPPIRNPYLERRALNYYWTYFVPPAMIARLAGAEHSLEAVLLLNALCAGLLFVASIYLYGWCVVPRAGPAATAVILTILAASAEGLFALFRLARSDLPLDGLRQLNVDAMTSWVLQGLTIDSLPRSFWYTPQHAAACALGLVALIVPIAAGPSPRPRTGLAAGIPLGLALTFSPFLGGAFCLIYGLLAMWTAGVHHRQFLPTLAALAAAAIPAFAALGWCIVNQTFEGADGAVAFGLSARAAASPLGTIALAAGPVLLLALGGMMAGRHEAARWAPAVVGPALALFLFYFVTLTKEPVWIGWRAGQILLVTLPPLVALLFDRLLSQGRRTLALATGLLALAVGLPTTLIDAWNAQDIENTAMGPGFRWTVAVPPDTQAAVSWIRAHTHQESVVQMSVGPRGRETWTLIPTFAERRMAAGRPISLLAAPEYDDRSNQVDAMFRTTSAAEASRLARAQRLDYVYLDAVERKAFGAAAAEKFRDSRYFTPVFEQGDAAVFEVR